MTNKNGCVGSYNVSGYTRSDGTSVSDYTRTCGAAHNSQNDENLLQERANLLYPNTQTKQDNVLTGGAAKINNNNQTIAGVERGEPMSFEDAGKGVNPNYNYQIRNDYTTNCQSSVAVFEARLRGYDIETKLSKGFDEVETLDELKEHPNNAYIDPKTGKKPYFTTLKVKNAEECEQWLNNNIKQGERYAFAFKPMFNRSYNANETGHILEVMKDNNENLKFYDPQINRFYDRNMIKSIKFKFGLNEYEYLPRILRVDDKEIDHKVLNAISKPSRKYLGK